MLNYAESQNEYSGPSDEVYQAIKDLRARAGIEAGDDGMYGLDEGMTQEEKREVIYNERRIELAFEGLYYWDLRRWKKSMEVMNEPIIGLNIIDNSGILDFNEVEVLEPSFEERQYLYPIPYEEVIKNDNMIQNPGW